MREARWLALRIPPLAREPQEFLRILEMSWLWHLSPGVLPGPPPRGPHGLPRSPGREPRWRVGSASSGAALHSGLGLGSAGSGWLRLACFLRFRMDFGRISVGFRLRLDLASAGFGLIWLDFTLILIDLC